MAKTFRKSKRLPAPGEVTSLASIPEWRRARNRVAPGLQVVLSRDEILAGFGSVGPALFSRLTELANTVLDSRNAETDRRRALGLMSRALGAMSPPGAPPKITSLDAARDLSMIEHLWNDFVALMTRQRNGRRLDSNSPADAAGAIRAALDGDTKATKMVEESAPRFLNSPLIRREDMPVLLNRLSAIAKPTAAKRLFAGKVLAVMYGVDERTAARAITEVANAGQQGRRKRT